MRRRGGGRELKRIYVEVEKGVYGGKRNMMDIPFGSQYMYLPSEKS